MTNLPKHRVELVKPFNHTGVDYTGHLWVKGSTGNIKMYLSIFTCLNVRAVHIEIVPDMTTHNFILAFLRFVNLYGVRSTLYSDNAWTFVAGVNILESAMVTDEFSKHFHNFNIKHIRIPAYTAWVGSTWERLIRTIKSCLYKTVGRSRLNYFELLTIIGDIQSAINFRPLTYRSSERDLEIITPNSFLKFNTNPFLLLRNSEDNQIWEVDPPTRKILLESLDHRNEIFNHFKEIWYDNYLLSLRGNYRQLHEHNWVNRVKAGDVVLIKLPNKPRPYWLLGRIQELIVGFDGKVRSVKVKRGDGQLVHHSINHLYPLELSLTHSHNDSYGISNAESEENLGFEGSDNQSAVVNELPEGSSSEDSIKASGENRIEISARDLGNIVDTELDKSMSKDSLANDAVGARPKRLAAKACVNKMQKWCQSLNQ